MNEDDINTARIQPETPVVKLIATMKEEEEEEEQQKMNLEEEQEREHAKRVAIEQQEMGIETVDRVQASASRHQLLEHLDNNTQVIDKVSELSDNTTSATAIISSVLDATNDQQIKVDCDQSQSTGAQINPDLSITFGSNDISEDTERNGDPLSMDAGVKKEEITLSSVNVNQEENGATSEWRVKDGDNVVEGDGLDNTINPVEDEITSNIRGPVEDDDKEYLLADNNEKTVDDGIQGDNKVDGDVEGRVVIDVENEGGRGVNDDHKVPEKEVTSDIICDQGISENGSGVEVNDSGVVESNEGVQ